MEGSNIHASIDTGIQRRGELTSNG